MATTNTSSARKKIIGEFSYWVAVSAARQGIPVRGRKLYPFLRGVDLASLLDPEHSWSDKDFAQWHHAQVLRLTDAAGINIGWSAKLINMLLKTSVYIAGEGHPSLAALIHPPIDNLLIQQICRRYASDPLNADLIRLCKTGVPISSIITYEHYRLVVGGLSQVARRENCSLFEVESLWSARDDEG
jgi:hypothetical protein